jgi:hypothetical protein
MVYYAPIGLVGVLVLCGQRAPTFCYLAYFVLFPGLSCGLLGCLYKFVHAHKKLWLLYEDAPKLTLQALPLLLGFLAPQVAYRGATAKGPSTASATSSGVRLSAPAIFRSVDGLGE